ncbi:MAG: hypothetical protein JXB38_07095 [Anaerolineales bacterium]|nr:hypothetical protein [Anaerolineales bacterium]
MDNIQTTPPNGKSDKTLRRRIGLIFALVGFFIFMVGADPGLFGVDRSPVIGFVQIGVFLLGLGVICFGGYLTINTLWNGYEKTIAADIGVRLVGTGYVIAVASGLADIFGLGTRPLPTFIPFFGRWQARGVLIGEIVIIVGFLLLLPYQHLFDRETQVKDKSGE